MPRPPRPQRRQFEQFSPTVLHVISDGMWPVDPADYDILEDLELREPSERGRAIWEAVKLELLSQWVRKHPGTRPRAWWTYAAPPEPRRRIGGTGETTSD